MSEPHWMFQEYLCLRKEILARQNRAFWTAVLGLLGIPAFTYIAADARTIVWLILPLVVLVVIVLFLAEQNAMMRAGRYIRERIESATEVPLGWEQYLESDPHFRLMEKHYFACFIVVFFAYYALAVAIAVVRLWQDAAADPSGLYRWFFYGGLGVYAIATLWGLATLLRHWKSSVTTRA